MSFYGFEFIGILSASGTKYVKVTSDDGHATALIPLGMFAGSGGDGLTRLKDCGLPIIGRTESSAFVDRIGKLDEFAPRQVVEKVGWNEGGVFAFPDGSVFAPEGAHPAEIALPIQAHEPEILGSLRDWKRLVARPLAGQPLLQFGTMFMLAPSLLGLTSRADNFGFELVGIGGRGKSTLQRIVTSVAGRTGPGTEGHYLTYFDTTVNALEDAMATHSDLPLLLEEANLFAQGETARSLTLKFKSVAFKLGSGTTKRRLGTSAPRPVRILYLSSSNEPLASIIGEASDAAKAAADRLITIPVPNRPTGVLDSVPEGFPDAPAFMDSLLDAASRNYGHALRQFVQCLVNARATDEAGLKASIAAWMEEFRSRVAPSGTSRRVIDAFGLVYAAGKLAASYGVLPKAFQCGPSAMACLNLYQNRRNSGLTFRERLHALVPSAVDLGSGKLPQLSDAQIAAGLFRRDGREGPELLITTDRISFFLPNWTQIRKRSSVTELLNSENGRTKIRRKIAAGQPKVRVYSFKLAK